MQRAKREESGSVKARRRGINEWENEIRGQSGEPLHKVERIKERAKELEEGARRKELLAKVQQSGLSMSESTEINEMYIESIKAKLAVLNNL